MSVLNKRDSIVAFLEQLDEEDEKQGVVPGGETTGKKSKEWGAQRNQVGPVQNVQFPGGAGAYEEEKYNEEVKQTSVFS